MATRTSKSNRDNVTTDVRCVLPAHITLHFIMRAGVGTEFVSETLKTHGFDPDRERALVFVFRRKDAENYASLLHAYRCDYYHAGRSADEREDVASRFSMGEVSVLFATKAFGMGVDIPNIHYVFHLMPPSSVEDYVQEIGRAGRDGCPSHAYLVADQQSFSNVRSRLVQSQIQWGHVRDMHKLVGEYRDRISTNTQAHIDHQSGHGPMSFVIPRDLIVHRDTLRTKYSSEDALETRQRMLLFLLEEAKRLEVGDLVKTHWPVRIGNVEPHNARHRVIVEIAQNAHATQHLAGLVSESDLCARLESQSASEARETLFEAGKVGCISIDHEVRLERTKWSLVNSTLISLILHKADTFLRSLLPPPDAGHLVPHAVVHPPYLKDQQTKKARVADDPSQVRFDERMVYLIRFLRRVPGLRVTNDKTKSAYRICFRQTCGGKLQGSSFSHVLKCVSTTANRVLTYLSGTSAAPTLGGLYNSANRKPGEASLAMVELAVDYLVTLGILRPPCDLIPQCVRIELTDRFDAPFDTEDDDRARRLLKETNSLRCLRLDALQVLTHIQNHDEQEAFARAFFDAHTIQEARSIVLSAAQRVSPTLARQFQEEALERLYNELNQEQQEVVATGQIRSLVVQAGPGTGKTRTLITCIAQRLIASDNLDGSANPTGPTAAKDILVLAYTRVVVEELRHRIRELMQELGRNEVPPIHTFHGYAKWKLAEIGIENIPLMQLIQEFNDVFVTKPLPGAPVHVFVDEFQDITEERAQMLSLILRQRQDSLVTVIGDPDQSIYEYDQSEGRLPAAETYFQTFANSVSAERRSLQINYRSERSILAEASAVIPRSLIPHDDAEEGEVIRLRSNQCNLVDVISESMTVGVDSGYQHLAVLFRTNSELYDALSSVQRIPRDQYGLRTLGNGSYIVNSREINEILEKLVTVDADTAFDPQRVDAVAKQLWRTYKDVWERRIVKHLLDGALLFHDSSPGASFKDFVEWVRQDLRGNQLVYATRLRSRKEHLKELVLSTMHRTKGLEFDSVIVAPSRMVLRQDSLEEEKRLRYVAISRARKRLILVDGPREDALKAGKEWMPEWNDGASRLFDTIDREGKGAFQLFGFSYKQQYIKTRIKEGDPLVIRNSALYHGNQRLCGISRGRDDLHSEVPLGGLFVSGVVRADGFGDEDKYKDRYSAEAQAQGWCYIINAAGCLRPIESTS